MREKLEKLEILRALACIGVFTYHSYITLLGAWGVSVFIMLSGFLLTYNGLSRVESFPRTVKGCALYSFRKIKKLYPLYFISLLFLVLRIVLLAPENPPVAELITFAKQFVLCVLLIQSWPPDTSWAFAFNAVGWYMSTSLILYFFFPYILRRVECCKSTRSALRAIVGIFLSMLLVAFAAAFVHARLTGADENTVHNFQYWFTYVFPPFRVGDFAIGCLLGYVFTLSDTGKLSVRQCTAIELAAIVFFLVSHGLFCSTKVPEYIMHNILYIPSSALLIYAFAVGRGHICNILDCKPLRLIADYSVEIFLIHYAMIKYAAPISTFLPASYVVQRTIFLGFTFTASLVAVFLYRRLGRRFPSLSLR